MLKRIIHHKTNTPINYTPIFLNLSSIWFVNDLKTYKQDKLLIMGGNVNFRFCSCVYSERAGKNSNCGQNRCPS